MAPTKPNEGAGLSYGELRVRGEAYDGDVWEQIDTFYEGGFRIEKNARKYMPPLVGEHRERHKERLQSAAYLNYLGQIVDYFTSAQFTQELSLRVSADGGSEDAVGAEPPHGSYEAFAKNADGRGTKFVDVLKCVLTTAMLKRRALLCIDLPAPTPGAEPTSLADEERMGLGRPFAYELPLEQVIDWDYDDDGGFRYVVIHRTKERKAPPGKRTGTVVDEFKVWEKTEAGEPVDSAVFDDPDGPAVDDTAVISWRLYRIEYPKNRAPKDADTVPLVGEGTVSFDRIPVLEFALPHGLWIGNKIVPVAREHFTRRSALNAGENRSLVAIPFVKKGPEIGGFGEAQPASIQQNPHRGADPVGTFADKGWVELGADDELGFAEPEGRAFDLVDKQLDRLKDEMFRIVHQMAMSVANNSTTLKRSGESKKEDRVAEAIVLGEFGRCLRNFAVLVYDTIAKARGDNVTWDAHGLDDYATEDREALLEEALSVDLMAIPSLSFKTFYKQMLAKALARGASPETLAQMVKEIAAGTKAEESMRVEADAAEHEASVQMDKANAKAAKSPKAAGLGAKDKPPFAAA